jgi:hypothetical protein
MGVDRSKLYEELSAQSTNKPAEKFN